MVSWKQFLSTWMPLLMLFVFIIVLNGLSSSIRQRSVVCRSAVRTTSTERSQNASCHRGINSPKDWSPPLTPEALQDVSQYDPDLVKHICQEWLIPPFVGERRLKDPELEHYSQRGQSEFIDDLLNRRTNGFFVESGASHGEELSNSLFFEKSRNWTGLLVEPNPESFASLLHRRRHSYMVNACLSPNTRSSVMSFRPAGVIGGLEDFMEDTHKARIEKERPHRNVSVNVQCFPLYSILRAMNVTHVDYFSLDIEGAELEVLYTIPLDRITIDVFSIEYVVSDNEEASKKKLEAIITYLVTVHGYQVVRLDDTEDVILQKVYT